MTRHNRATGLATLAVAAALLTPALAGPTPAAAAPIKECGRHAPGGGYGVYNITTRIVSCRRARSMARAYYYGRVRLPIGRYWWGPFRCVHRRLGSELNDLRCVRYDGRGVVHWQDGS
jgi:hypothetical protein